MAASIYLRVSTQEQAESQAGLNAQLDACLDYARRNGIEIAGTFADEGVSGTADIERRPGLLAAIDALQKGDQLIVSKRDRLGRDVMLVKLVERMVTKKKARIHALNGSSTESPEGALLNNILDASAAYEIALIRARTKAALGAKKARGERMGKLPFGFTTADGVHLMPCPQEQAILTRIAALRAAEYSLRDIASALNGERLFNRQGQPWNHVSVHTLCKNLNERLAA